MGSMTPRCPRGAVVTILENVPLRQRRRVPVEIVCTGRNVRVTARARVPDLSPRKHRSVRRVGRGRVDRVVVLRQVEDSNSRPVARGRGALVDDQHVLHQVGPALEGEDGVPGVVGGAELVTTRVDEAGVGREEVPVTSGAGGVGGDGAGRDVGEKGVEGDGDGEVGVSELGERVDVPQLGSGGMTTEREERDEEDESEKGRAHFFFFGR